MGKTAKQQTDAEMAELASAFPVAAKSKPKKSASKARRPKIYTFDPVIYPFKVWVAVEPEKRDIISRFYGVLEGSEDEVTTFSEKDLEKGRLVDATTFHVHCDGKAGALVIIWRPKCFDVNGMSHEASHVTDLLCEYLGINGFNFNDGEARAYFNGWVAECLDKAKRGKV